MGDETEFDLKDLVALEFLLADVQEHLVLVFLRDLGLEVNGESGEVLDGECLFGVNAEEALGKEQFVVGDTEFRLGALTDKGEHHWVAIGSVEVDRECVVVVLIGFGGELESEDLEALAFDQTSLGEDPEDFVDVRRHFEISWGVRVIDQLHSLVGGFTDLRWCK